MNLQKILECVIILLVHFGGMLIYSKIYWFADEGWKKKLILLPMIAVWLQANENE